MFYDLPLYRPPSERESLILQITLGCSHNRCTFCSMYKTKKFYIKTSEEIDQHINWGKNYYPEAKRIFLADGNALAVETKELIRILKKIYKEFPHLERVTAYAGPKDLLEKSEEELRILNQEGLEMLYLGVESGSGKILNEVKKGVTPKHMIIAANKAKSAGFKLSCTIISGLGGKEFWQEHAEKTAEVLNSIDPHYLGVLTLLVESNTVLYRKIKEKKFKILKPEEVIDELILMIEGLELTNCIFRSNHPSNYLTLKGTLNQDKEKLLAKLFEVKKGKKIFKPEGWRLL